MPPKKQLPQPIDRPLSRAYLRQFKGWSTAYPPGLSDPASLRTMENMLINRDGSIRIRPGLRSVMALPSADFQFVGTYEPFYLNDGTKAYLIATRFDWVDKVIFGVLRPKISNPAEWELISIVDAGFAIVGFPDSNPSFTAGTTYVKYVQIDNKILALSNNGEPAIIFHAGATKKVVKYAAIADPPWVWGASRGWIDMPSLGWILSDQSTFPTHAADFSSSNSIAQSVWGNNPYNIAFCYTFASELGETAPSEVAQFKIQRPWGGWLWNAPDTALVTTQTSSPHAINYVQAGKDASDQLSLNIPEYGLIGAAAAAGATKINFYVMSWSNQDSVPVEMQLVGSRDLTPGANSSTHGWFMLDPSTLGLGPTIPVPTATNRANINTTEAPRAAQGLVAADRLVLVQDPTKAAVIRWTGNNQGDYLNFAANKGGGYKTLTSGNMQVPACAKLWQNPQSADTITVLNSGTDSYSTAYYMAPASVTSQSDNTNIMGFEETTATPGTTSPYGCEVANNALYHPLDDQLMKSTASNYNINHKSMTDQIVDKWTDLAQKQRIVSCFHDQRLYYLVNNPEGAALETQCNGNEIWVFDLAAENGNWSRWLVQGVSLRKVQISGKVYLSVVHPKGIRIFDEERGADDSYYIYAGIDIGVEQKYIPWRIETNTQGANRAHDAWSHLRQISLTVGNFTGQMKYGIRGKDLHGKVIDIEKVYRQHVHSLATGAPFDAEDHLRIAREMKEWFFHAESVTTEAGLQPSYGQLNLVQYRYTPVSVNVGYEFGTVESFEYGRDVVGAESTSDNGIPRPYMDTSRP